MDPIVLAVLALAGLLGLASLLVPAARALSLPYTVLLAAFGVAIGAVVTGGAAGPGGLFGSATDSLADFSVSSEVLLYVLLPPLLFAAGLTIDVRRLLDEMAPVLLLAIVAVFVCMAAVGVALAAVTGLGLVLCLLVGAIVATTDTAAVLGIFRDIGAPRRLSVIVEGESLFNDAAAIALFGVLLGLLTLGAQPDWLAGTWAFLKGLAGGVAYGYVLGRGAVALLPLMRGAALSEITLTLVLTYMTFVTADVMLGVSGIIAVVTASLAFAADARTRLAPATWAALLAIWRQLDFWAATLIFVLAATVAPAALSNAGWGDILAIAALYVAALAARAAVLFGLLPVLSWTGLSDPVEARYKLVLLWGSMRGAVTVALALALQERADVSPADQTAVLTLAVGYVLVTLFLNGTTLRLLMRGLRLDVLDPEERLVRDRVMELSRRRVAEETARIARDLGLPASVRLDDRGAAPAALPALPAGCEDRVGLMALANRETELVYAYAGRGTIGRRLADLMLDEAGAIRDGAKTAGRPGYEAAWRRNHEMGWRFRLALWLQRRFGWQALLADEIALRLERLLVKERLLVDLSAFAGDHLATLVGPAATARLTAILAGRSEAVHGALAALDLQYPDYAAALRRIVLARISLGLEQAEYRQQRDETLISPEVYEDLEADIARRAAGLGHRPKLDLGLSLATMLVKVPAFSGLGPQELSALSRYLTPVMAVPGELVIRKGARADAMYFVASGSVAVYVRDPPVILEAGAVFGEMALLHNLPRNADVVARAYCELLALRRADMDRFLRAYPKVKQAIADGAAARMVSNREHVG